MSGKLKLILGGAKSGKSSFAMELAEKIPGEKIYLATAQALDDEMKEKIKRHKKDRSSSWETIEETEEISQILKGLRFQCSVVVLDCITLWLSNLLHKGYDEGEVFEIIKKFLDTAKKSDYSLLAVSNEVGMGIVPKNKLARQFRDIAGKINQEIAKAADEVYFVFSGIPKKIKP